MSLSIISYELLKDTIESQFKIKINITNKIDFILKYPSNPILDCKIINFNDQPLKVVLKKLIELIEEDNYCINTRIQLTHFKNIIVKLIGLIESDIAFCN
jgi:hypothetical protein|tara:strand:+ start:300 stop:599 length:300 start_codon:yes stop_codon:yes gene_type:complete